MPEQGPVAVHHPLGLPRRAGRVGDEHRVGRDDVVLHRPHDRLERRRCRGGLVDVLHPRRRGPAVPHQHVAKLRERREQERLGRRGRRQLRGDGGEPLHVVVRAERRAGQDHLHVGVSQHRRHLGGRVEGVHRCRHAPDPGDRRPGDHPLDTVGQQDPDLRALAHPPGHQPSGQPRRSPVQLRIGHALVRRRHGQVAGVVRARVPQEPGDGGDVLGEHGVPRARPRRPRRRTGRDRRRAVLDHRRVGGRRPERAVAAGTGHGAGHRRARRASTPRCPAPSHGPSITLTWVSEKCAFGPSSRVAPAPQSPDAPRDRPPAGVAAGVICSAVREEEPGVEDVGEGVEQHLPVGAHHPSEHVGRRPFDHRDHRDRRDLGMGQCVGTGRSVGGVLGDPFHESFDESAQHLRPQAGEGGVGRVGVVPGLDDRLVALVEVVELPEPAAQRVAAGRSRSDLRELTGQLAHLQHDIVEQAPEHVLLGGEVEVEGSVGDAGHPADVIDTSGVIALLGEDRQRGIEQAGDVAPTRLTELAPPSGLTAEQPGGVAATRACGVERHLDDGTRAAAASTSHRAECRSGRSHGRCRRRAAPGTQRRAGPGCGTVGGGA